MKSKLINKLLTWAFAVAVLVLAVLFIVFTDMYKLLFVNQMSYEYGSGSLRISFDEASKVNRSYNVSYPNFWGSTSLNQEKFELAYAVITSPGAVYATEIVREYKNCAELDFDITIIKKETLTISFFGFGYPDLGEGEPVLLNKEFVFDISDVSKNSAPLLISADGVTVTDENRWIFYYPQENEKPEGSMV